MTVPRTAGPAYANLQWRKPREVWRSCASDAMGISALAVCCRRALNASLGSGRRGGGLGRPIAIGRTGVAQRRLIGEAACPGGPPGGTVYELREQAERRSRSRN